MEAINPSSQVIADSIKNILAKYDNPQREGLLDTPKRVAKMYDEILTPPELKITVFDAKKYDQLIIDKGIEFYSLCEHHLLPFFGSVSIGYLPKDKIIGLSKLSRIVEHFSRRLNTQEYLTENIADYLNKILDTRAVGVVIKARHLCKEMRGIKSKSEMMTSCLRGLLLTEQNLKEEFFNLIK